MSNMGDAISGTAYARLFLLIGDSFIFFSRNRIISLTFSRRRASNCVSCEHNRVNRNCNNSNKSVVKRFISMLSFFLSFFFFFQASGDTRTIVSSHSCLASLVTDSNETLRVLVAAGHFARADTSIRFRRKNDTRDDTEASHSSDRRQSLASSFSNPSF